MKNCKTNILLLIALIALAFSCKTYYVSTDSLRDQFSEIDSSDLRMVNVGGPVGESYSYLANPIDFIQCTDKNHNLIELESSPSIEIRVTDKIKKRTTFYFDRIYLTDSLLIGNQSRFISVISKAIPLKDIVKIEVQDGKKNFQYVTK